MKYYPIKDKAGDTVALFPAGSAQSFASTFGFTVGNAVEVTLPEEKPKDPVAEEQRIFRREWTKRSQVPARKMRLGRKLPADFHQKGAEMILKHPRLTPQQAADALGPDAAKALAPVADKLPEYVANPDGTVVFKAK
jgi:hypothetical protein